MKLNSFAVLSLLIFCYPTLYAKEYITTWCTEQSNAFKGITELTKTPFAFDNYVRLESNLSFDHVSIDQNIIKVVFVEKFSDYNLSDLDIVLNEEDGTDRSNLINSVQVNSGVNYIEKGNNYLQVNFTAGLVSSTNVANKNITSYILTIKDSKGNSFSKRFIYEP